MAYKTLIIESLKAIRGKEGQGRMSTGLQKAPPYLPGSLRGLHGRKGIASASITANSGCRASVARDQGKAAPREIEVKV